MKPTIEACLVVMMVAVSVPAHAQGPEDAVRGAVKDGDKVKIALESPGIDDDGRTERFLTAAATRFPTSVRLQILLSFLDLRRGRLDAALDRICRTVDRAPRDVEALLVRSEIATLIDSSDAERFTRPLMADSAEAPTQLISHRQSGRRRLAGTADPDRYDPGDAGRRDGRARLAGARVPSRLEGPSNEPAPADGGITPARPAIRATVGADGGRCRRDARTGGLLRAALSCASRFRPSPRRRPDSELRNSFLTQPTEIGSAHEDAAHQESGDCKELGAVLPAHAAEIHETHVGLMDESRRCQRVIAAFGPEAPARDPPQICVDRLHQPSVCGRIALAPRHEPLGHAFLRHALIR
jgi:hypothetical protein